MSNDPVKPAPAPVEDQGSDQTTRGVLLGFASFAAFCFSDASVKLIEGALPPYESAFFGAVFALCVLPFLMRPGDRWTDIFATRNRPLWLLRFVSYPMGVIGSVTAFTHLPMAEAFCLIFLQPAFVTVMSVLFLKEKVGVKRWGAVVVGFIGVLIVLRPGFRELSIGHLGAIFAGLGGAVSVITFRAADAEEKKVSLFGAGILGGIVISGAVMIPSFEPPTSAEWAMLASYGLLAAGANLLLMSAAQHAPAAYIGPTQYSQMVWAILLGYLVFGDAIDTPTLAGIVLIVASGLLTLIRERQRGTSLPPPVAVSHHHAALALTPDEPEPEPAPEEAHS
ncbi:DMT family transporter [Rhizobiaceae bacterium BDR2-2]|uniref:DMT family transporter n=1 Tax=Ectorhizobium quercum TaxID=2965071 RepID=A0AAE3N251_9HYPH|nr:DMT family transporter [Ectorhizobium quercum]MCX8999403.1 DMT family transporter [Ectorhizobium quercum]